MIKSIPNRDVIVPPLAATAVLATLNRENLIPKTVAWSLMAINLANVAFAARAMNHHKEIRSNQNDWLSYLSQAGAICASVVEKSVNDRQIALAAQANALTSAASAVMFGIAANIDHAIESQPEEPPTIVGISFQRNTH